MSQTLAYDDSMFQVKICGITTVDDALDVATAGADAVGLNFYPKSKRFIEPEAARRICVSLPPGIERVGVFVNAAVEDVVTRIDEAELTAVQLHGEEPPSLVRELPRQVSVIRAYRCGEQGLAPLGRYLAECRAHGRLPDAVLVDAEVSAEFGGTGHVADWARIADERDLVKDVPLILAGGLTPDNVAVAIATVRPDGVDVATGVESAPGRKDAARVTQFVVAARQAFAKL